MAVKDAILECMLIGVSDERWGEAGCLYAVAKPNQNTDKFRKTYKNFVLKPIVVIVNQK